MRAILFSVLLLAACPALAQESGGSFGGSTWDDDPAPSAEPSYGGGGYGGGSESWGSSSNAAAEEAARAAEAARLEAERRAAEERERARIAAEEAARRAEAERIARERARLLALPPIARARELDFPAPPPRARLLGPTRRLESPFVSSAHTWMFTPAEPPPPPSSASVAAPFRVERMICPSTFFVLFFLPITFLLTRSRRDAWKHVPDAASAPLAGAFTPRSFADTSARGPTGAARRVTLAFDWTARAELQRELSALSSRLDMKSRPGLHAAATEVAGLLTRHGAAARYATWELSSGDARSWFQSRVGDLRSRFQTDTVRNVDGQRLGAGEGSYTARPEEGEGLVVVTVLCATKTPMRFPSGAVRPEDVGAVLAALAPASPAEMLALEVIWSPSAENDRMSSLELERFYPELQRFGDGVGRYGCTYCKAPYPRELGKCPSCGGPAS